VLASASSGERPCVSLVLVVCAAVGVIIMLKSV